MIVECEECHANLYLDESAVSQRDRRVRCSKCRHVFWVRDPQRQAKDSLRIRMEDEPIAGVGIDSHRDLSGPTRHQFTEPMIDVMTPETTHYEHREATHRLYREDLQEKPASAIGWILLLVAACACVLSLVRVGSIHTYAIPIGLASAYFGFSHLFRSRMNLVLRRTLFMFGCGFFIGAILQAIL